MLLQTTDLRGLNDQEQEHRYLEAAEALELLGLGVVEHRVAQPKLDVRLVPLDRPL